MAHLIEPPSDRCKTSWFLGELERAHHEIVEAATAWMATTFPEQAWGASAKRSEIPLEGLHPWIGTQSQPFGELLNQLATIERLLDALEWSVSQGLTEVVVCHPTTSSGDHDLVTCDENSRYCAFEVSDVAGASGNQNGKMKVDIQTFAHCICAFCTAGAERYLATSPSSSNWLVRLNQQPERLHALGVASVIPVATLPRGTKISHLK